MITTDTTTQPAPLSEQSEIEFWKRRFEAKRAAHAHLSAINADLLATLQALMSDEFRNGRVDYRGMVRKQAHAAIAKAIGAA